MSLQVEKLENNTAKLTIEVPAEELDKAIQKAYQKNKNKFNVPGFRKGKVPYAMIEKMYGAGVFYEEAANDLIPEAYANAAAESELEIVARPEISVTQIEKGKPFVFEAEVTLKPEVKLGEYKGIKVEKADTKVTAKEVNAELDKIKEQNARLVAADDKAIEEGDQATIDFEGFVDGVAFEGGKGEDYPLTIGSHSFIDTFEDQLVGKKVGEEVEVNVTFPEEYHAENLAGKPVVFKVKVNEVKVKELPELNEDNKGQVPSGNQIELRNVSFAYEKETVLQNISLVFQEKEKVAIVGPSGAGKTTIANLLARFWDVSEGSILIGGVDYRNLPLSSLMSRISYVTQDTFLFNLSILENIRLGNPSATDEQVIAAATQAQCAEFIDALQEGYHTIVGNDGIKLSGGQRQRIIIARAILKNAPILILDEATAYTDMENQHKIQVSLQELCREKTLIVIAHRLTTIKNCDKIVVLNGGRVAAVGSHEELLKTCAVYQKMWSIYFEEDSTQLAGKAEVEVC